MDLSVILIVFMSFKNILHKSCKKKIAKKFL